MHETAHDENATHKNRLHEKLRRDFGPSILNSLADPQTIEILLNADGTLWQECLGCKMLTIGTMPPSHAEAVHIIEVSKIVKIRKELERKS